MDSRRGSNSASSNRKGPATPLPYEKVTLLGLILSANNTSIWMIFSFLPFMVQYFFPALSKAELGYYAGILGSAFSAGSLIGNIIWGVVSDRYGRRPALLFGLFGTAICSLVFGFSPSFWMAVAFRFFWGLLNGNVGVAKTYLAEISDDTNSAKGMALFGVIGGFGRTIGPIIGGFLSSPAELYPQVFSHTIFETYPYALPSLVICINCSIVLIISYLYLSETISFLKRSQQLQQQQQLSSSSSLSSSTNQTGYALLTASDDPDDLIEVEEEDQRRRRGGGIRGGGDRNGRNSIELRPLTTTNRSETIKEEGTFSPLLQSARKTFSFPAVTSSGGRNSEAKKTLIEESQFLVNHNHNTTTTATSLSEDYEGEEVDDVEAGLLTNEKKKEGPSSTEIVNELISFQDLDSPPGLINSNSNSLNHRNNNAMMMSSSDKNSNNNNSNNNNNNKKNRLTFNGVVQMKVIGSNQILYSSLKVAKDELPIIDFSDDHDDDNDGVIAPLHHNHNHNHPLHRGRGDSNGSSEEGFSSDEGENGHHHGGSHYNHKRINNNNNRSSQIDEESRGGNTDGDLSRSFSEKKIRFSNGSEDFFDENNRLTVPTTRSIWSRILYLLRRKEILISTLLYGTNALTMIATNEIFPLWVVTPVEMGGFAFTSDKIGMSTMICGIFSVLLQVLLYPKMVEWLGTMGTYKLSTLFYAIGAFIAPMISLLDRVPSPAVQWIGIVTAQILLTVPSSFVLVTVFVFINNSCYSQHRATVNGIGQTFASLGRLIGPYCAARLFAWSETNHRSWPFNYYFTFYVVGFITLFNWYLAIFLPRSIERRKREPAVDFMKHPLPPPPPSPSIAAASSSSAGLSTTSSR